MSIRYRRRLATNSSRNPLSDPVIADGGPSPVAFGGATGTRRAPPVPTGTLPDDIIMGVEAAPARAWPGPRRAPQIALFPDESTRRSSLRSPSSLPSTIVSHDPPRDIGERARLHPVPSPSLPRAPLDRRARSAPARQPGPNHPH